MAHPHWPLFDLEVVTPRITLRYLDDALAAEMATLAAAGIHDPTTMPFAIPWTDIPSPGLERQALQYYWRMRADTSVDAWNIQMAVLVDGRVIGSTSPMARRFGLLRTFETGSWLGREHQGRGLGTEVRLATLHLGFLALDAERATTAAFDDNPASLGVTRKLGYTANGRSAVERRPGEIAERLDFEITRQQFLATLRRDDIVITGDAPVRALLGISRPGE